MAKPVNGSVSSHVDDAKVLLDKIRALRAEIPRFQPAPADARLGVALSSVPGPVIESASVAIEGFAQLERAALGDALVLRDASGYAQAYEALVVEFNALGRSMAYSIRLQQAEAARSALDIYAMAQRLSKRKGGEELLPFVTDVRKKMAAHLRSRKANSTPTSDETDPAAPPVKV